MRRLPWIYSIPVPSSVAALRGTPLRGIALRRTALRRTALRRTTLRSAPLLATALLAGALARGPAAAQGPASVELSLDVSQAEAVLAIVARHAAGEAVSEPVWEALFATEPYRRLKQRELAMGRAFGDDAFRTFATSPELAARAPELRRTLERWEAADLDAAARRVLAYLPPEARIRATVYPVIKPQPNSFVYDLQNDPAIFLYLDPDRTAAQFENTVAHELHHVGLASIPDAPGEAELPPPVRTASQWMGAFGEGLAMLAAAGDVDTHPHAVSPPSDRERWDRDMARFDRDLRDLETFFLDLLDGRLTAEDEIRQRGFGFFGEQGPWYTVGYGMAVTVERRFGREALFECMRDPRRLLVRYTAAAGAGAAPPDRPPPLWSERLIRAISR